MVKQNEFSVLVSCSKPSVSGSEHILHSVSPIKGSDLPGEGVHFCFFSCLNSVWSLNVKFGHKAQKWIKFKMICIKKILALS